jgi:hypothetical protein
MPIDGAARQSVSSFPMFFNSRDRPAYGRSKPNISSIALRTSNGTTTMASPLARSRSNTRPEGTAGTIRKTARTGDVGEMMTIHRRLSSVEPQPRVPFLVRCSFGMIGAIGLVSCSPVVQNPPDYPVSDHHIVYHDVRLDSRGNVLPWFSDDPAKAYDHNVRLIWNFWIHMRKCPDGVPYYLQHQVWRPGKDDPRGLGGDQINMALDSWDLLYDYLGDPSVKDNMILIADYWLDHGMSSPSSQWPSLPFPYNTEIESGQYDGDMRAGKGFLQPDKAGSFGSELITLYKKTGNKRYLDAAIAIADTLVAKIAPGDSENSPWPFRVNATTGRIAQQQEKDGKAYVASYTTNWAPTLRLFGALEALHPNRRGEYHQAANLVSAWLKKYPLANNRWGPFFEDIGEYSDTEINADTMAAYILEHPEWDSGWKNDAQSILKWSEARLGNHQFESLNVVPINEQTAYLVPGNSHTSRHGSVELLYCEKTGDNARRQQAIHRLNWATYSVNTDGSNRYPNDEIWLTDGYGDYVRHYLRSMASLPELAPKDQNHLLRSSSVIQNIQYSPGKIAYTKFDSDSVEVIKVGAGTPSSVRGGSMKWDPISHILSISATSKQVVVTLDSRPTQIQ